MLRSVRCVFSAFVLVTLGACAVHEAEPAFRASVYIGDRGISIPLPPPSLVDEPKQDVDVEGDVMGQDEQSADDLVVHVVDQVGGAEAEAMLTENPMFKVEGLPLDLTDNCLEVWIEDANGQQSEHLQVRAAIGDDDQTIVTTEGCQ